MMPRILITPRSLTRDGHPALKRLEVAGFEVIRCSAGIQPGEDELCVLLKDCVGYLAGVEPISSKVMNAAKVLRVISRNGTGIDNIDLEAASKAGIRICRAAGANARGVAELTLGLLLALARSIPYGDGCMKRGAWERRRGFEIEGKTLGLIGFGKIGGMVGSMASALGMAPIAFDPIPPSDTCNTVDVKRVSLKELYAASDVISLHCPSQPLKKALIDHAAVSDMKKGVYLINTARADLIDMDAVLQGLETGHIAGVAVDVYDQEPPVDRRLIVHDRVIATPHTGGFTGESVDRATGEAVDNLLDALTAGS